jgi:hypothetical protein
VAQGWVSPPAPGRPTVSDAEFADKIRITWAPVADGLFYRVWRKDSPSGTLAALSSWQSARSYDDFGVDAGHTYYYAIQAANDDQGTGASEPGQAYGGSRQVGPPTIHATDGAYDDRVAVYWPAVANAPYYRVWRRELPAGVSEALTEWDRSRHFEDTTAVAGVMYDYTVRCARSMSGYGESADSAADSGFVRPPAPASVEASDGTDPSKVRITWDEVFTGAYYRVSRSETVDGTRTDLGGWIGTTAWDDSSAAPGQTYYYHVEASPMADGAGTGPPGEDTGWRGVAAPAAPAGPPSPGHLVTEVGLRPTLDWPDCDRAISYGVSVWTDAGPYGVIEEPFEIDPRLNGLTESSIVLPDELEPGTTYYWQVYARNLGGETAGPVWEFTTAGGGFQTRENLWINVRGETVELTWQGDGEVWIQFAPTLTPESQWEPFAGPIVGETTWTGPLPAGSSSGFFRLVRPAVP